MKSKLKDALCGNDGKDCLRKEPRDLVVEKVSNLAKAVIKNYARAIPNEGLDAIATKFGELAANEGLKGWCMDCRFI